MLGGGLCSAGAVRRFYLHVLLSQEVNCFCSASEKPVDRQTRIRLSFASVFGNQKIQKRNTIYLPFDLLQTLNLLLFYLFTVREIIEEFTPAAETNQNL